MRVLFAGGGTGGHLFPALAIADEIRRRDADSEIAFVGTRYGIEYRLRDSLGYPLQTIAMRGLPRRLSPELLLFPFRLLVSVIQARSLCRRFRPDVVVGTGGYVAGPPIIAAARQNIPCVLQEQNSYPGLVTRRYASRVKVVFLAYRKAQQYLPPNAVCRLVGNPVRSSILGGDRREALKKFNLREDRKTILVLGGSQGARRLNEAILNRISSLTDKVQLLWQCGKRDYKDVAARLNKKDFAISLFPFSNDMGSVYAAADLAIARAGALTIAELMANGVPAIFVPYPFATADHQTYNAREIAAAKAAEVIAESDLEATDLPALAMSIITSERLAEMKAAARALGRPGAAGEIAREIMQLAGTQGASLGSQHRD